MAFTPILIPQDFAGKGAMSLPDQPAMPAEDLKAAFDSPARQVCAPAFNRLITEMGAETAAASLGAEAPTGRTVSSKTVQAGLNKLSSDLTDLETSTAPAIEDAHTHENKALLDTYEQTEEDLADAVAKKHEHENKAIIDKFADNSGLEYDGTAVFDYDNQGNKPQINGNTLTGNKSNADLGIPTTLAELSDDATHRVVTDTEKGTWNGKSLVSYVQTYSQAGQKIGTITIDGTPTDLVAPTGGGGGGGGAVDSVNGQTGIVVLDMDDINDTSIASLADQDTLVYNGTAGTWGNEPLADVALTNSYNDLDNLPTIPDGLADLTDDVAISSPSNGQILQHNGTKWANANMPSIPSDLDDLSDVVITTPSADQVLKYDGTSSKWINATAPTTGHVMNPLPDEDLTEQDVVDAVTAANSVAHPGENDEVASLFGIASWSNTMSKTFLVKGIAGGSTPISQTGIGTWPADIDNPTALEKANWIPVAELYNIGAVGKENIEVKILFDPAKSGTVALGGWIIDDNETMQDPEYPLDPTKTISCGKMCIKFANEISEPDTHTAVVGVKIIINRTETVDVSF